MSKLLYKVYNNSKKEAKTMLKTFTIVIHETDEDETGYWAECVSLPGCFTDGETIEEVMENMKEAIALYLEDYTPKKKIIEKTITLEVTNA